MSDLLQPDERPQGAHERAHADQVMAQARDAVDRLCAIPVLHPDADPVELFTAVGIAAADEVADPELLQALSLVAAAVIRAAGANEDARAAGRRDALAGIASGVPSLSDPDQLDINRPITLTFAQLCELALGEPWAPLRGGAQ